MKASEKPVYGEGIAFSHIARKRLAEPKHLAFLFQPREKNAFNFSPNSRGLSRFTSCPA